MRAKSEGYTMIGDTTVYEPKFAQNSEFQSKRRLGINQCNIDICSTLITHHRNNTIAKA